jgi:hypothetical protein
MLVNQGPDAVRFFGSEETARDAALNSVEEFDPIVERRVMLALPQIVAAAPLEEFPAIADVVGIDLNLQTVGSPTFPTDFSLGHDV